jgi:hypothetical protein
MPRPVPWWDSACAAMTRRPMLIGLGVAVVALFCALVVLRRDGMSAPIALGAALLTSAAFAAAEAAMLVLLARGLRQPLSFLRAAGWLTLLYMASVILVSVGVLAVGKSLGSRLDQNIWSILAINGLYGLFVVYLLRKEFAWKATPASVGASVLFIGMSALMILAIH